MVSEEFAPAEGGDVTDDGGADTRGRAATGLATLLAAVRRDLADGVYHPHERLVEADLVERYGTTRGAVREALIQLASEGLVERSPNRGARVRGMSLAEAIEIAEVRRALETLCAGLAASRATPPDRLRILGLSKTLQAAAADGRVADYLTANAEFHGLIQDLSGHAIAQQILATFRHRPIDRFFPQPFRARPPMASVDEHERIAAAIAAGDVRGAELEMHEHLTSLVEMLRSYEERTETRPAT